MTKKIKTSDSPASGAKPDTTEKTYSLRIQAIRAKGKNTAYYVYLPLALVSALGMEAGEEVSWELLSRDELHLIRHNAPQPKAKKRK